jgi:hypothetical protein
MASGVYTWSVQAHDRCRFTSAWADKWEFTVTEPDRSWTLMFYLSGDNNQHGTTTTTINELEALADNNNIAIVVLRDGEEDGDTTLYHLQHDTDMSTIASPPLSVPWNSGELNMGDPQTVQDFVAWAQANYTADHFMLTIFDHGGGWAPDLLPADRDTGHWGLGGSGLAWDMTSNDYLSTSETGTALAGLATGSLDIVLYDASLMATLESAYEIKDGATYLIASENAMINTFPYDGYMAGIDATTTPQQLAEQMVDAYGASLSSTQGGTIAALNLSRVNAVQDKVDTLAALIRTKSIPLASERNKLGAVYADVQKFDYDDMDDIDPQDAFIDLQHFASLVSSSGLDGEVTSAANDLVDELKFGGIILKEAHISGSGWGYQVENAHGVSIYAPFGEELYVGNGCTVTSICAPDPSGCTKIRDHYTGFDFVNETQWDELIDDLIQEHYCITPLLTDNTSAPGSAIANLPAERPVQVLSAAMQGNQDIRTLSINNQVYLPLVVNTSRLMSNQRAIVLQ